MGRVWWAMYLAEENSHDTWGSAPASTHIHKIIFHTQNSHLEIAIEHKSKWIFPELPLPITSFASVDFNGKPASSHL